MADERIILSEDDKLDTAEVMLDDIFEACDKMDMNGVQDFCSCASQRIQLLGQIPTGSKRSQTQDIYMSLRKLFEQRKASGYVRC